MSGLVHEVGGGGGGVSMRVSGATSMFSIVGLVVMVLRFVGSVSVDVCLFVLSVRDTFDCVCSVS